MSFRNNLQLYIDDVKHSLIVFRNEHCVVIKDKYPKSMCHFLVLPVDESVTHLHPLIALEDHVLRQNLQIGIEAAKDLIVKYFVQEGFIEGDETTNSDFKDTFIKVGVHSIPSMANLHIHVLTKDMCLPCMKNKKHYNSFNTDFFVDFVKFETITVGDSSSSDLDSDMDTQIRNEASRSSYEMSQKTMKFAKGTGTQEAGLLGLSLTGERPPSSKPFRFKREINFSELLKSPLRCTYCNQTFGNKIAQLKEHLRGEFVGRFGSSSLTTISPAHAG